MDPISASNAYPKHPLSQMLGETARRLPEKAALIDTVGNSYSYRRIWQAANGLARFLQRRAGIRTGETVAILAPNGAEYAVALHGALLAGARVTPLNPLYREREVEHQLDDAAAVVIFVAAALQPVVDAARAHLPGLRAVYQIEAVWGLAEEESGEPEPIALDPERDLAFLPYSSGTTGLPKGVMLTHYNLTSNIRQCAAMGISTEDSVVLAFLPFFHIYGATLLLNATLAFGGTCVVMPRFDPEQALTLIEQHRVTDLYVAP